jgi:hypothetical protein
MIVRSLCHLGNRHHHGWHCVLIRHEISFHFAVTVGRFEFSTFQLDVSILVRRSPIQGASIRADSLCACMIQTNPGPSHNCKMLDVSESNLGMESGLYRNL